MQAYTNKKWKKTFKSLTATQILMDLLYKTGKYEQSLEVFEHLIYSESAIMARIALASLLKIVSWFLQNLIDRH